MAGCAVLMSVAVPPGAAQNVQGADDIESRKEAVERRIDRTGEQLDQSSARLTAATRQLDEALTALDSAQTTLARTRGELAAAEALDSQMQAALAEAVLDLRRARRAAARSRARVEDQEDVLRKVAVAQYASGAPSLHALSMVLNTQDTATLTSQLNSVESVLDKEAVSLDHLEASRVVLVTQQAELEEARREVARRRAAAAENLERKARLEAEAEQAQADIEELVTVRSRARREAARARAEDLRQARGLEEERERISDLLRARAEEARRKAAAAAAARARAREEAARQAARQAAREAAREAARKAAARKAAAAAARRAAEEAAAARRAARADAAARRAAEAEAARRRAAEARAAARRAAEAEAARRRAAEAEAARRRAAEARAIARRAARSAAAARSARRSARPSTSTSRSAPRLAPAPGGSGLGSPVDGYITSSFGMRFHPVYKRWSLHDGTDFGASCGTPVRAASSGTVIAVYYHSAYGNRVIMDHGYRSGVGLGTSYNHLSAYSTHLGQRVQRGEVIGYVGTTGASTGCHLHFMVFENGAPVNPANWL